MFMSMGKDRWSIRQPRGFMGTRHIFTSAAWETWVCKNDTILQYSLPLSICMCYSEGRLSTTAWAHASLISKLWMDCPYISLLLFYLHL